MLLIASKQLFASFPDKPAPCGPQCMTFLPIMSKIGSTRESSESGAPSMNVREPAVAPTTPPDMGASTKRPCCVACTALATSREDDGSMVEQSMKRRSGLETTDSESGGLRICPKTLLTWVGSGRFHRLELSGCTAWRVLHH